MTQPARKAGRGRQARPTPVGEAAVSNDRRFSRRLPVKQVRKTRRRRADRVHGAAYRRSPGADPRTTRATAGQPARHSRNRPAWHLRPAGRWKASQNRRQPEPPIAANRGSLARRSTWNARYRRRKAVPLRQRTRLCLRREPPPLMPPRNRLSIWRRGRCHRTQNRLSPPPLLPDLRPPRPRQRQDP